MASNSLLSLRFSPIPTSSLSPVPLLPRTHLHVKNRDFSLSLPRVASSSSTSTLPLQPINVDYLAREFSGHGVTFEGIGDSCVAKLCLENGSTATLMLPSGLVTSYKAPMWHGEKLELLQTIVSEGEDGEALIQGGVSLELSFKGEDGVSSSWSPRNWALSDISGNPDESIEVELISSDSEDMVEVKYVLTLQEQSLSSKIKVLNLNSSPMQLTGSIISHVGVSTPDATYAIGLVGSNFYLRPPLVSEFWIIPPADLGEENELSFAQILKKTPLKRFIDQYSARDENTEQMEGEEDDDYKRLTEEMSMIYTSAPTFLTIIDRGKRNSVVVGREGFDELYIYSPGSKHEFYTKYSYICVGPTAMLKPVTIRPREVWTGTQYLHNPNL